MNDTTAFWQAHYPQPVYQNGMLYPFSMAPYTSSFDMEKDILYSKQMYPKCVKRIQAEIEEECDKLEYKDSFMFDETPDRLRVAALADRIYERVADMDLSITGLLAEEVETRSSKNKINPAICYGPDCQTPPPRPCHGRDCPPPHPRPCHGRDCRPPRPDYGPDGRPNWLRNLVEIMLHNEMNFRRNRYRERNRWY